MIQNPQRPEKKKEALRHIAEPTMGTLRDLEEVLKTKNVPTTEIDNIGQDDDEWCQDEAQQNIGEDTFTNYYKTSKAWQGI